MDKNQKIISIAVVDDDIEVLNNLKFFINASDGFKCTGIYESCSKAIAGIMNEQPDILLMDIGLPDVSGIKCLAEMKKIYPDMKIVMQTVFSDDEKIFESLKAGAVGYILKKTPLEKILISIKDAHEGGVPMTGEIAHKVLQYFSGSGKNNIEEILSAREIDVLKALYKGYSYSSISEQLFVSVNTVRFHIKNIYEKLHVKSRSEAIAKVIKEKLL